MFDSLMDWITFTIAIGALIATFRLNARVSDPKADLAEVKKDARRRVENLRGELEAKLDLQSAFLAKLAAGEALDPAQIREGRLWRDVTPPAGRELVESNAVHVLDVRTPAETSSGIIPGAQLIPVDQLEARVAELPRGKVLLITCAAGGRSAAACEFLSTQGFAELINLEGGMSGWSGKVESPPAG